MLKERVLSAIVLIALVLCALFLFTPFYFALALGFVATLGIWEWAQFARFKNPLARLCIAAFLGAFIFLWLYNEGNYLDAGRVFENYLPFIAKFSRLVGACIGISGDLSKLSEVLGEKYSFTTPVCFFYVDSFCGSSLTFTLR